MPTLQPYPAYADTDLPWLPKIPKHWEIRRLKQTIEYCQNGAWGDEPNGIDDVPCVRVADFDRTKFRVNFPVPTLRALPKSERKNKSLKKGDLLIEKSGGGDLQPVGFVVLYDSDEPAICSNFVARMPVLENYDPNFLCYLHASLYAGKINTQSIKQNTGIQNLDSVSYLNEKVALPPLPEQRTIAAYLDRQTAKIDALIAKKQRLLDLLSEQRAALISQAVTKGLNPAVKMKDSGVAWLGQVPSHWEVRKVSHLFGIIGSGSTPPSDRPEWYDQGEIPWVQTSELRESLILDTEKKITKEALKSFSALKVFPPNSLLVAMYGATIGRVAILGISACTNQACCVLAKPQDITTKFAYYWFIGYREQIVSLSSGGGQPNINQEKVRSLKMSTPPYDEQIEIVDYLDQQTKQLSNLVNKIETAIERLQEYRAALISSVVTGKVQVSEL